MRKIAVDQLQPSMILGRSLFSSANTLALAAGQKLDTTYIKMLVEHGYQYVFIEDDGFEAISPQDILSDTTRRLAENAVSQGVTALQNAVRLKAETEPITEELLKSEPDLFNVSNVDEITKAVAAVVRDIIDRNIALIDVFAQVTGPTYLYRHAVNVTALSVLFGREFGYTSRQLRELALGALLHDFGKVCLGENMLHPKHDLQGDDLERFKEHPTFGAIIMQNTDPTLQAEYLTILHHHECQNGTGYPQGIEGDNLPPSQPSDRAPGSIHQYAEIVAVAEAYDNLVNGKGELPRPLNPADALGTIMSFSHLKFNQAVCHAFSKLVCLYPTGSMVQILESGSFGLIGYYAVVKDQGADTSHPTLILYADPDGKRVKPKTMDFSEDRELKLKLMV